MPSTGFVALREIANWHVQAHCGLPAMRPGQELGRAWIPRLWTANQGVLGDNCAIASSPLLLRSSTLAWPHASVTAGDAVIVPEVSEQLFDYRGTVGALFGFNGLSGYC